MDPWSKVDYSRFIREASMVVEKLPEVIPPSGRVPGRGLLVLSILEARRRRNRGEIAKKGSRSGGFTSRGIYMRRGAARGPGGPVARPHPRARQEGTWGPGGSPLPPSVIPEASVSLIFHWIFPNFEALLIWGKPEIEKQQKIGTGTGVH